MSPTVSIIIPVYGQWDTTSECLKSLYNSSLSSGLDVEIIIADDASPDPIPPDLLKRYSASKWPVRHLHSAENAGFLRNCNQAVDHASGRYLCFLNNDVLVEPQWLDRLHATLSGNPQYGVVGALVLNPDRTIQECGCAVLSDGSTLHLGNKEEIGSRFDFTNEVDYVSGACLLIASSLFKELGRFDTRYIPSYYEDVDLCFRVAEKGYKIVVDPSSRIVHLGSVTHGREQAIRLVEINRRKFYARWKERLVAFHPDHTLSPGRFRCWQRKGTIAVHYNTLKKGMDSASRRCWQLLHGLRSRGYHVVLVYNTISSRQALLELHNAGIETLQKNRSSNIQLNRMLADHEPMAVLFSFTATEEAFSAYYRKNSPKTLRLFDTPDLTFVRKTRERAHAMGFEGTLHPTPLTLEDEDYRELLSASRCDGLLAVSETEKSLLVNQFHLHPEHVSVLSTMHGIDPEIRPFDQRSGFIYLGHFNFQPNLDAIRWLVKDIWPEIRCLLPSATLRIYGSYMPDEIRLLHNPDNGILIAGYVPDHIEAIRSSRAMLVPLRFGAGIKGKINEALSTGTPVITTNIGAEGIDPEGFILSLAEDSTTFARLAVELHENRDVWNRHSSAGPNHVSNHFGVKANIDRLVHFIEKLSLLRNSPDVWAMTGRMVWILSEKQKKQRFSLKKIPAFLWRRARRFLDLKK